MAVESIHPGIDISQILANTGFKLHIPEDPQETLPPTKHELNLIRHKIDPFGIRDLELLDLRPRFDKIQEVLEREKEHYSKSQNPQSTKQGDQYHA